MGVAREMRSAREVIRITFSSVTKITAHSIIQPENNEADCRDHPLNPARILPIRHGWPAAHAAEQAIEHTADRAAGAAAQRCGQGGSRPHQGLPCQVWPVRAGSDWSPGGRMVGRAASRATVITWRTPA